MAVLMCVWIHVNAASVVRAGGRLSRQATMPAAPTMCCLPMAMLACTVG